MTTECRLCGSALEANTVSCMACGTPIAPPAPPLIDGAPNLAPSLAQNVAPKNTRPLGGAILGLIVLALSALLVFRTYGFSAETVGYWLGELIIPSLLAYAISGARKRRNWLAYSGWLLLFVVLLNRSSHSLSTMSKPELMRQLSGVSPEDPNLMGNQREVVTISRAVFASLRQFQNSQESARAELEATYREFNTPESFSSRASVDKVLDALAKTTELDAALTSEMNDIPNQMRAQAEKSDLSASERVKTADQMINGYRNSQSRQAAMRLFNVKSEWISSETDLYQYAKQHLDQILIKNDQIRIGSDAVLQGFNSRFDTVTQQRRAFIDASNSYQSTREDALGKYGVSAADLGLK